MKKSKRIISKLKESNLDFNHLFLLECYNNNIEREFLTEFKIPSIKYLNLSIAHQLLLKHQFLVKDPENSEKIIVSLKGKEFLLSLQEKDTSEGTVQAVLFDPNNKSDEEKFDEWWKTYPRTGTWETEDGSCKFISSRNLKNLKKPNAKKKYLEILNQGISHEDMIGGLKHEVKLKKLDSVKKKENQMEYFKGMESYLNSGQYMNFIEEYKANPGFIKDTHDIKGKKLNVTDI